MLAGSGHVLLPSLSPEPYLDDSQAQTTFKRCPFEDEMGGEGTL